MDFKNEYNIVGTREVSSLSLFIYKTYQEILIPSELAFMILFYASVSMLITSLEKYVHFNNGFTCYFNLKS